MIVKEVDGDAKASPHPREVPPHPDITWTLGAGLPVPLKATVSLTFIVWVGAWATKLYHTSFELA